MGCGRNKRTFLPSSFYLCVALHREGPVFLERLNNENKATFCTGGQMTAEILTIDILRFNDVW